MDPFKTGLNYMTNINLSVLRLCFQVFIPQADNSYAALTPVVSEIIRDKKTVSSLTITKLSHFSAPATGGTDLIVLCERILGDDVQVWFFETRNSRITWEVQAAFRPSDVHKQVAISIRTPAYHNVNIPRFVQVFIQLRRSLDIEERGVPRHFYFTPKQFDISDMVPRKIRKVSKIIERYKGFLTSEGSNAEAAQCPKGVIFRVSVPRTTDQNMQYEELLEAASNPFLAVSTSSLNLTSQSQPISSPCTSFLLSDQSTDFEVQSQYKRKSQELSNAVSNSSASTSSLNLTSQSQPIACQSTSFLFPTRSTDFYAQSNKYKRKSQEISNPVSNCSVSTSSLNLTSQSQPVASPSTSFLFPARSTDFEVQSNKYKRNSLELSNAVSNSSASTSSLNLASQSQPIESTSTSFFFPAQPADFGVQSKYKRKSLELTGTANNSFISASTTFNSTSQSQPIASPSTSCAFSVQPREFAVSSKHNRKSPELSDDLSVIFPSVSPSFNRNSLDLSDIMANPFPPLSSALSLTSQKEAVSRLSTTFEDPAQSTAFDMPPEVFGKLLDLLSTESNSCQAASISRDKRPNLTLPSQIVTVSSNTSFLHTLSPSLVMSPDAHNRTHEIFPSILTPVINQQELATCELDYENETYSDENDLTSLILDSFSSITLDCDLPDRDNENYEDN